MKRLTIAGGAFTWLLFASVAFAQQTAGGAPPPSSPLQLPKGKVAVVDSSVFVDQVNEFQEKITELGKQLELRNKEVKELADKITATENTLQMQRQILSTSRVAEMTGNLDTMKRDYQRKATDLRDYAAKEQTRAFQPLFAKLAKFAEEYSARRNIVLMIDLGSALEARALVWHSESIDVTKDFVAEYNRVNPVSAPAKK